MTPAPETDQAGPASWDPVDAIVQMDGIFASDFAMRRTAREIVQRVREEARAAERARLEPLIIDAARAAVIAVCPLEAMNMAGPKGIAPELWVGIQDGITAVRSLVIRPEIADRGR